MVNNLEDFHDAEVIKIEINSGDLHISVNTVDNKVKNIKLIECKLFRVNDFIHQNVISRILPIGIDSNDEGILEKISWATEIGGDSPFMDVKSIKGLLNDIRSGSLLLVYFEPSWGAEIVAVCRKIEIGAL
ncbi:hypothetical protein J2X72_002544 [Phyllobacterium sp. 1468]|uniref:hypothetical protein n=1 Tax=Phyllobacterium sp. 1468 TaxID=2817759 RepID=UPI00286411EE|nr:hypothetical protein [Phyllobacterium sp. 1468]MDR6633744.1 hypothetical protein [Phyllobacterium sp. 1468]